MAWYYDVFNFEEQLRLYRQSRRSEDFTDWASIVLGLAIVITVFFLTMFTCTSTIPYVTQDLPNTADPCSL